VIVNALNKQSGTLDAAEDKTSAETTPSAAPLTGLLSLLHGREAVSLYELTDRLNLNAADIHSSLAHFLQDGTVNCLSPVSLSMVPENLDNPNLSRQVFYRVAKDHPVWKGAEKRLISWTHLSKRPHLSAD
jgi:hypothetical protein